MAVHPSILASQQASAAFAKRLDLACERSVECDKTRRQSWLREQLKKQFNTNVSNQAVSQWFSSEITGTTPRPGTLRKIAKILNVDPLWLDPRVSLPEQEASQVSETSTAAALDDPARQGAAHLLAGMICMSGGSVSLPHGGGPDLVILSSGRPLSVYLVLLRPEGQTVSFTLPFNLPTKAVLVGAVLSGHPFDTRFLHLSAKGLHKLVDSEKGETITLTRGYAGFTGNGITVPEVKHIADLI